MKKKLLIIVSALMMLFGSALTVSAEESDTEETAIVKPLEYVELYYEDKKLWLDDDGTLLKGGYRIEVSIDKQLDTPVYACFIKLDSKGSEERPWYELYVYDYDKQSFESGSISIGEDSSSIIQYNIDKDGNETVASEKAFNILNALWLYAEVVDSDGWRQFDTLDTLVTNIPMFDTEESAKNYFVNGDRSGIINDSYDNMVPDDSFGLKGFQADNTITATWTGTTHDDVIDTYNKAKVGIRPWYYYKSAPDMMAFRSSVIQEYDIADKTFTKLYEELKPSDETLFLRYLEVIPNYQKTALSTMYVGKSCWIWFNADGTVEKVVNDIHENYPEIMDDADFELSGVSVKTGPTSLITGKPSHKISWTGSTKDDILKTIPLDKTYISVFFYGGLDDGSMKLYDYEDVYVYGDTRRVHGSKSYTGNSFEFMTQQAVDVCEDDGRTFMGEVWLTPYYTVDNCIYKGKITVVNVLTGQVGSIDIDNPDNPVYPDEPEEPTPDNPEPDVDLPDIPSIDDIFDVIPYFITLIKHFYTACGEVPAFLSKLFSFLPSDMSYMLCFGMVMALILRLVGR